MQQGNIYHTIIKKTNSKQKQLAALLDPDFSTSKSLLNIIEETNMEKSYYAIIRLLLEHQQSLTEYMVHQMIMTDNKKLSVFSTKNKLNKFEFGCLSHDLALLTTLFQLDFKEICHKVGDYDELLYKIETYDEEISADSTDIIEILGEADYLIQSYLGVLKNPMEFSKRLILFKGLLEKFGIGSFVLYPGFTVHEDANGIRFKGIKDIVTLDWDNIYHYPLQKEALLKNTKAFVENKAFQNVLLVGASGTGKSTSVKSVVKLFANDKLRLIQMQKGQLNLLPKVLEYIDGRGFKFILFIDDLSFEANEDEYKFLKSFIEGSISGDTSQVAFYVTSNRRHLIKEIRSERENDIHLNDFIQEMTSLSDRFGLTLLYEGLVQKDYFDMVGKMYGQCQEGTVVPLIREELDKQARIYALRHGKMSGRVAMQFIKQLGI